MDGNGKKSPDPPKRGRRALGRGLDALLPSVASGLRLIDVREIEPNPDQPRQRFEPDALRALAESLRNHGMLQPVMVTQIGPTRYRIIVGERRWQAAKAAELPEIPAIVREATDRQSLELALIENVQRHDLNPLEEATAYRRLIDEFGLTQQEVAVQVGRNRATVANTLRLLALPETLKRAVIDERISEGHARALLGFPTIDEQLAALDVVERTGLSVRQTEELVRRSLSGVERSATVMLREPDLVAAEDNLRRSLGARVTLKSGKRGGRIVIEYFSPDEFDALYRRLLRED